MAYIIYLFLVGLNGVVLSTLNAYPNTWQFWAATTCVLGAWICGREYDK